MDIRKEFLKRAKILSPVKKTSKKVKKSKKK